MIQNLFLKTEKSKKLMKLFTAVLLASALISPTKLSADGGETFVGRDRYETNFKTVQNIQNPEGIIVASSEGFPDSLSAISLVRVTNYPLVLTSKNGLNSNLRNYASQSSIKNIIVVGGKAKCNKFENKNYIYLKGRDRYDTNSKVFDTFKYTFENPERCVLASGENFADSLSACNVSLIKKCPIKLSRNVTSNNSEAYIVGGFGGRFGERNVNHTTPKLKDETELIVTKNKNEIEIKQVIKPKVTIGKYGDRGRLYLPSINASVALYDCPPTTSGVERSQGVVDAEDSAAVMEKWFGNGTVIGDHNNQAFRNLKRLSIGDVAYIDDKDGKHTYRCKEVDRNGLNLVTRLIDSNGDSAWDKYPLSLYTCNDALGKSVTIARFVLEKN
jgi:sortase (surface protein transpeptidase)